MKALQNTLFSKSPTTVLAWVSIILPIVAVVYAIYGGVDPSLANYLMIGAAAFFLVGLVSAIALNSTTGNKKQKIIITLFDNWRETFQIPEIPKKDKLKSIKNHVSYSWTNDGQLETFIMNGNSENITPENIVDLTSEMKKLNPKKKKQEEFEYVVKLDEVALDGSVFSKQVNVSDSEYRNYFAKIKTALILTETIGDRYGTFPIVSFSESFETGETEVFDSIMVTGNPNAINEQEIETIIEKLSESFPLEENQFWNFRVISPSVFSFKVVEVEYMGIEEEEVEALDGPDPDHDFSADGEFLSKAFTAATRKAEVEGIEIVDIDLLNAKGTEPYEFDVSLEIDENVNKEKITLAAKFVVALLKHKYGGIWRIAITEKEECLSLVFKRFE